MNSKVLYNIVLFSLLFPYSMIGQSRKTIRELHVRSVAIGQTDYAPGKPESIRNTFTSYDKRGNPVLEIEYNRDSTFKRKEQFFYNRHNDLVKTISFDQYGKPYTITETGYDNFKNKISETVTDSTGNTIEKTTYSYNAFGLKTAELTVDAKGNQKKKVEYEYDTRGAMTRRSIYDATGNLLSERKIIYGY